MRQPTERSRQLKRERDRRYRERKRDGTIARNHREEWFRLVLPLYPERNYARKRQLEAYGKREGWFPFLLAVMTEDMEEEILDLCTRIGGELEF